MAFVVISYPDLAREDYDWIQTIRAQYDAQYKFIAPHFTLVFPFLLENSADLIQHVQKKTQGIKRIPFVIRQAITVKDKLSESYHLFLTPDEGSDDIIRLHDNLYTGILAAELRRDIPFIPHITLGNIGTQEIFHTLTENFNAVPLNIKGTLGILEIASLEGQKVLTQERISLGE
jgi:2'-5' RNA ligase